MRTCTQCLLCAPSTPWLRTAAPHFLNHDRYLVNDVQQSVGATLLLLTCCEPVSGGMGCPAMCKHCVGQWQGRQEGLRLCRLLIACTISHSFTMCNSTSFVGQFVAHAAPISLQLTTLRELLSGTLSPGGVGHESLRELRTMYIGLTSRHIG